MCEFSEIFFQKTITTTVRHTEIASCSLHIILLALMERKAVKYKFILEQIKTIKVDPYACLRKIICMHANCAR